MLHVGLDVGLAVGVAAGLAVGIGVGLVVGIGVGLVVGLCVGIVVGIAVGIAVGFDVGSDVGIAGFAQQVLGAMRLLLLSYPLLAASRRYSLLTTQSETPSLYISLALPEFTSTGAAKPSSMACTRG